MEKFVIDLFIALALLGGLLLCVRLYLRKKIFPALLVIFGIGLLLRGYLAQDPKLHDWDEKYHALVAKNLAEHPTKPTLFDNPVLPYDDKDWSSSHLWFSKPPFALWTMAGSIALFGNNEYAVRIPSLIISILGIYLTFLIGRELFGKRVGLIAAFLHSINGLLIELAAGRGSSDHVETMFIVMVELAVYFSILSLKRKQVLKWTVLSGVFTAIAFLTKWFPAFLVFPVWFIGFVLSDRFNWKRFFLLGAVLVSTTVLLIAPWILTLNSYNDNILGRVIFAFGTSIQGHERPFWYYFNEIMITFGELIYLPIFFAVYRGLKGQNKQELWMLLTWILLPLFLFSLGATKRYTYILISAPALFILIAYLVNFLVERINQFKPKIWSYILIAGLLLLPVRFTIERLKLFQKDQPLSSFYLLRDQWENRFNKNDVVVGCRENIELMFYTDIKAAYPFTPDKTTLTKLVEQGHDVFIYSEGEFKEYSSNIGK